MKAPVRRHVRERLLLAAAAVIANVVIVGSVALLFAAPSPFAPALA